MGRWSALCGKPGASWTEVATIGWLISSHVYSLSFKGGQIPVATLPDL
jgi:hypothetical protein